jgi:hypothetical protein
MNPTLMYNLDWLHGSSWVDKATATEEEELRFIEAVVHTANGTRKLASVIRSVSAMAGLPYSSGTSLFKYLVWNKFILTDLSGTKLNLNLPCLVLRRGTVVEPDITVPKVA